MDSPVTEKMCKERHENFETKLGDVKTNVTKLYQFWVGNGKLGANHKIETLWQSHITEKKTTQGLVDWAFRLIIVTVLGIILHNTGLK